MSSASQVTLSLGATDRRDLWWLGPAATAFVLLSFVVYSSWAALQNAYYQWGPYLSPFYSPLIRAWWLPAWISPAVIVVGAPLGFRVSCYYYRKAYYRAFFLDPAGCAVGEGKGSGYRGERAFPFILQNLHRFFMYLAIIFLGILGNDVFRAFQWNGHWGMGLGTLIMLINLILLSSYTLGCHSLRHLIGGKIDCFSCQAFGKQRYQAWKGVSWLNQFHMRFAWASLIFVGFTDFYIRMCSMGIWHDPRFF